MEELFEQYNKIGERYISGQSNFFGKVEDKALEFILNSLPDLSNKKMLDLGCGNGKDLQLYKKLGANLVFGIDSSEYMVKEAKRIVSNPDNIYLAEMENTKFDSNSFDLVVSRYALHYLKDYSKFYKEIARVLKKDGLLIFVVPHPFRDLVLQSNKKYGQQEVLAVELFKIDRVTVKYPSHTFSDYFCQGFFENFFLENFSEDIRSDEFLKDEYALPGGIGIVARRK